LEREVKELQEALDIIVKAFNGIEPSSKYPFALKLYKEIHEKKEIEEILKIDLEGATALAVYVEVGEMPKVRMERYLSNVERWMSKEFPDLKIIVIPNTWRLEIIKNSESD
jgi:hypothetical protein